MKLVFAGTPEFASAALDALIAAGHEIVLVLTQPDRPAGRGMRLHASAVKTLAIRHGIAVLQPAGLRIGGRYDADARAAYDMLRATPHDSMIVAAYGLILPQSVLDIAPLGCINIHASLLPRWRGAAPVQRAIEAGDHETGITIMQMDAGLDTGPAVLTKTIAIEPDDTGATLTGRLARLGGEAIVDALALHDRGAWLPHPQVADGDTAHITYAHKVGKHEGLLDFDQPARLLADRIRAFDPWPGCAATLVMPEGSEIAFKIWRASAVSDRVLAAMGIAAMTREPGQVLTYSESAASDGGPASGAVLVATGDGVLALTELQKPAGKRLPASTFARDFGVASALRFRRTASA